MLRRRVGMFAVAAMVAALMTGTAFAATSSAAEWKIEGTSLSGSESVVAETSASTITWPGIENTCEATLGMTISNSGSEAVATVESMSLSNCGTSTVCTIEEATAEGLPWSGTTVGEEGSSYLAIEGFDNELTYGNEYCALDELTWPYKGTIRGLFDNSSSKLIFDETTGSSLHTVGNTQTGYEAEYEVRATGAHAGQTLTLS